MTLPRGGPPPVDRQPPPGLTPRVRGTALAVGGILVLSPDTLLIRLVDLDPWTIVFGRGVLTSLGMLGIVTLMARRARMRVRTILLSVGWAGVLVACIAATADLLFVVSIANTHVANTLVIFAAAPLLAAVFSRIILAERVRIETWVASSVALIAIAAIFSRSLGGAALLGDGTALAATVLLAINLTIVRRNRHISMLPALVLKGVIAAVAVAPFADPSSIRGSDAAFLALNGLVVIPLAISMLMVAPRLIPAPDVALIHLLETGLGPLWVWMALGEVPPATTVVAGGALLATLAVHSWLQIRKEPRTPTGVIPRGG